MPGPLRIRGSVVIPEAELRWRFSRSSGPGGQSVNTTDSRVELSYDLAASAALGPTLKTRALRRLSGRLTDGVLTVTASEHRSQLRNRKAAEIRLAGMLDQAIAPPPRVRRPTKPSRASVERRLAIKRRRGDTKRLRGGRRLAQRPAIRCRACWRLPRMSTRTESQLVGLGWTCSAHIDPLCPRVAGPSASDRTGTRDR